MRSMQSQACKLMASFIQRTYQDNPDNIWHEHVWVLAGAAQAPQAATGTLRFHPDTLQRALTDQALGLILPPTLHISFQPPHHPDQLSSTQPSSSQESASQPQSNGESGRPQQHPQLLSLSSQQGSQQYSQQLSQQAIGESQQGPQWRRLSGGPEGAGFGGNRGSIWAMVAAVGSLVPLTMQVSCSLMHTVSQSFHTASTLQQAGL